MSRYIDADELWKEIESVEYYGRDAEVSRICGLIQNAPTAEVKPIVYGEWIVKGQEVYCSKCNERSSYNRFGASAFTSYCPNCGTTMKQKRRNKEEEE